jgi:hypothetical protein
MENGFFADDLPFRYILYWVSMVFHSYCMLDYHFGYVILILQLPLVDGTLPNEVCLSPFKTAPGQIIDDSCWENV